MSKQLSPQAATAAALRKELKAIWPGVKFSVTSSGFSGGDSVDVHYTDGPVSELVETIARRYQFGWFDGMTDSYEYHADYAAPFGVHGSKYVMVSRTVSVENAERIKAAALERYGDMDNMPGRVTRWGEFDASIYESSHPEIWPEGMQAAYEVYRAEHAPELPPIADIITRCDAEPDELTAAPAADADPATIPAAPDMSVDHFAAERAEHPTGATYEPDALTVGGVTLPASYAMDAETGAVIVAATLADGKTARIILHQDHADYAAALDALHYAEADELPPIVWPERKPRAERKPRKKDTAPLPEWAGETLRGNGFRVEYDADERRTMIVFERVPRQAVRDMVKEAGFYWSPTRGAWVRGLDAKSKRKAEKLAAELAAVQLYDVRARHIGPGHRNRRAFAGLR